MEGCGQSGGCGVEESGQLGPGGLGWAQESFHPSDGALCSPIRSHLRQMLGNRLVWAVRTWGQESSMSPGEAPGAD